MVCGPRPWQHSHPWYRILSEGNQTLTVCVSRHKGGRMYQHASTIDPSANGNRATVIVCAFASHRLDQTVDCVTSVLSQDPPPTQMIVVVDHNETLQAELRARLPGQVEIVA